MNNKLGLLLLLGCIALSTAVGISTESIAENGPEYSSEHSSSVGAKHDDDDDEHEREEHSKNKSGKSDGKKSSWYGQQASVVPVSNPTYTRECASCHFSYLPGLLPAASWKRIMATLDDHYGDDASLPKKTADEITEFLLRFAADTSDARRSRQIMASLKPGDVPVSITDIPYIQHKHREIPQRMIKDNKKVRTLSNCKACHDNADRGVFTEHGIKIPGFGYWED